MTVEQNSLRIQFKMAAFMGLLLLFGNDEENEIPRNNYFGRHDAFGMSRTAFIRYFRLDKESVIELCDELRTHLPPSELPVHIRVLIALRFLASGSYQNDVANSRFFAVSQSTTSRNIVAVTAAISTHLTAKYIKFPTPDRFSSLKMEFYQKSGFPGTIAAIDCTHVAIISPSSASFPVNPFYNRHRYTSLNVQLIVGPDLEIYAVNAKFPGSVHDSFIWRNSVARHHISQITDGWLVGDSGYPLETFLMTPFLNPLPGSVEENYNKKHSSARSCVERCNGVLKSRFRCLLQDRTLNYTPTTSSHIVNTCVVLHNICNKKNLPVELVRTREEITPNSMLGNTVQAQNLRYRIALSIA